MKRTALVAQPPRRMYELINDIEGYPLFVPGVAYARVEARSEREIVATLGVRRGPLNAEFTTRNELEPHRRIAMHLVRGPFRALEGEWLLTALDGERCRIDLAVRFAFANRLSGVLFEPVFQETVGSLVDAFVTRAHNL
ncbi:MAG TPA: type II toxin-antitoxin system RatA family toxin [Steroidobacteraceae bacterium]|nr:type II toxin-antitoxin system RatA family toxin [Steroidobacteraceae bacterium]